MAGGHATKDWDPDGFVDEAGTPLTPSEITEGFGLEEGEYEMYFPKYDDWQKDFAELDYGVAEDEEAATQTLLSDLKTSTMDRLGEKREEVGLSLASGIGGTYSQAANQLADATAQSVGQQTSFTSGASGRQQQKAFSRTQETMMQQVQEQNQAYTSTTRDILQAETDVQAKFDYDTGKAGRDLESAGIDRDYKTRAGKEKWEESIYDTLRSLASMGAWDDEDESKDDGWGGEHDSYQWYNPADWFGMHDD